ncbi:MAG: MOSC domain-containing protein [Candidatus Brocadia sp. UTAMX2]|jgi:MOSC domain-containing protein YiiM|nr:MAG: MOSC domain-containing protein [Candidatus Brocadia sp. UTAMX2]
MREARILSVQAGLPRTMVGIHATGSPDKPWQTGIFKAPVYGHVWLGTLNLDGDAQADLSVHGGPHKAINAYPSEHYPYWKQTLHLPDMPYGAFGENFTTSGLLEDEVCIGDVFHAGEALVQVSQPRQPCWKIERRWEIQDFGARMKQTGKTGWYFRVLREGYVEAGNTLVLTGRSFPQWTVATAYAIMRNRRTDATAARELARCPALSPRWQENLIAATPG